jgi:hypothetical protein
LKSRSGILFGEDESLKSYMVTPVTASNRWLAVKDILPDLAGGCFLQLGHKLDSVGTLEVRQMITSVVEQFGFRPKIETARKHSGLFCCQPACRERAALRELSCADIR